jgi:hypothetical protein
MTRRFVSLAALMGALLSDRATAQVFVVRNDGLARAGSWSFDVGGAVAEPVGEFRSNVNQAWGASGALKYYFRRLAPLGLRADFTYLNYGSERQRVPLSSTLNRVLVDMRTTNNIAIISGGPELVLWRGPVSPYVYGFAGYSYFFTESSASDYDDQSTFASSTNFDDGGLATGWGGGVRIPLRLRSVNAAIDAGVRHTKNGVREYLRPGDIRDIPNGFLAIPRQSAADFRQYHLGVSFSWRNR